MRERKDGSSRPGNPTVGTPLRITSWLSRRNYSLRRRKVEMSVIQILVVDDSLPWQRFVQNHLDATPELKVIDVAADGSQAVQKAKEAQPHLVLMDICLPGMNGIEATRQIRRVSPGSKLLFVSTL